jgi:hypothetical protein
MNVRKGNFNKIEQFLPSPPSREDPFAFSGNNVSSPHYSLTKDKNPAAFNANLFLADIY